MEDYFAIHHGYEGLYSRMGPAQEAAKTLLNEPVTSKDHATGQYHLPLEGVPAGEMTVVVPQKVKERKAWEANQIEVFSQKIQKNIHFKI